MRLGNRLNTLPYYISISKHRYIYIFFGFFSGLGISDVENQVSASPKTVMRIASISKPITMAIVAKLWEDNKLDLDEPVTKYVKDWPETVFNNKKVRTYNVSVVRFYFVFNQHSNHPSLRRRLKPSNTCFVVYTVCFKAVWVAH